MNDKTRKSNEPAGRGRVVTGKSAAAEQRAGGAEVAAPEGAAGSAEAPVANGAGAPAGAPVQEPAGPGRGADGAGAAARSADEQVPPRLDPEGPEAVTTELRLPTSDNGSGSAPRPAPESAGVSRAAAARPSPGSSAPRPTASPGAAPSQGGPAAGPPPWHRMPGQDAPERQEHAADERPAGGLLEEAPTTFLEPPALADGSPEADEPVSDSEALSAGRPRRSRPPRQAALQLKRLDPWSVLKLGLVLAVVLFFIWMVAIGVLYGILDGMGVWDRLNGTYADLVSGETPTGSPLISAGRVFGLAAVIGAINSLLFAVAVTIGAFVYNVSADLVGGIEVTLSERD